MCQSADDRILQRAHEAHMQETIQEVLDRVVRIETRVVKLMVAQGLTPRGEQVQQPQLNGEIK